MQTKTQSSVQTEVKSYNPCPEYHSDYYPGQSLYYVGTISGITAIHAAQNTLSKADIKTALLNNTGRYYPNFPIAVLNAQNLSANGDSAIIIVMKVVACGNKDGVSAPEMQVTTRCTSYCVVNSTSTLEQIKDFLRQFASTFANYGFYGDKSRSLRSALPDQNFYIHVRDDQYVSDALLKYIDSRQIETNPVIKQVLVDLVKQHNDLNALNTALNRIRKCNPFIFALENVYDLLMHENPENIAENFEMVARTDFRPDLV